MKIILLLLLAVTVGLGLRPASAAPDAPPRVAVFSQPDFPYFGVPADLSPKKIAADLQKAGVLGGPP